MVVKVRHRSVSSRGIFFMLRRTLYNIHYKCKAENTQQSYIRKASILGMDYIVEILQVNCTVQ